MNDLPRQKLQELIARFGRSMCDDPQRCEAILNDLCQNSHKREIKVLITALKEDVAAELLQTAGTLPVEDVAPKLTQRLYEHRGMAEEFAFWAIETWALALALIQTPLQQKPTTLVAKVIRLRSEPQIISAKNAAMVFRLDRGGHPLQYIEHVYEDQVEVVADRVTNLMWQKSGSNKDIRYQEVSQHIEELNRQKFAGYADWRLPTIPELMSLLEPMEKNGDLYIDPMFDRKQRWCWSADRQADAEGLSNASWNVYFIGGIVRSDSLRSSKFSVRAVRSSQ